VLVCLLEGGYPGKLVVDDDDRRKKTMKEVVMNILQITPYEQCP
jgi:hypothetical protein